MARSKNLAVTGKRNGRLTIPSRSNPPGAHCLTYDKMMFVNAFCAEAKGNASEAARMIGCSDESAKVTGSQYLTDPNVRAAIARKVDQAGALAEEMLARDVELARFSAGDYLRRRAGGEWEVDVDRLYRDGKMHMIKEVIPTKYGMSYKFHDPIESRRNVQRISGAYANDRSTVVHQIDLTLYETHPRYRELAPEFIAGKLTAAEFIERIRGLDHQPYESSRVIDGEGLVHVTPPDGAMDPTGEGVG